VKELAVSLRAAKDAQQYLRVRERAHRDSQFPFSFLFLFPFFLFFSAPKKPFGLTQPFDACCLCCLYCIFQLLRAPTRVCSGGPSFRWSSCLPSVFSRSSTSATSSRSSRPFELVPLSPLFRSLKDGVLSVGKHANDQEKRKRKKKRTAVHFISFFSFYFLSSFSFRHYNYSSPSSSSSSSPTISGRGILIFSQVPFSS